jgi:hypothetical protein
LTGIPANDNDITAKVNVDVDISGELYTQIAYWAWTGETGWPIGFFTTLPRAAFDPAVHNLNIRMELLYDDSWWLTPRIWATDANGVTILDIPGTSQNTNISIGSYTHWMNRLSIQNLNSSFTSSGIETDNIPEPATLLLLAAGAVGLIAYGRKHRRAS